MKLSEKSHFSRPKAKETTAVTYNTVQEHGTFKNKDTVWPASFRCNIFHEITMAQHYGEEAVLLNE